MSENCKKVFKALRKYTVKMTKSTNIQDIFKNHIYYQTIKSGKKGAAEIKIPILQGDDFFAKLEEIDDVHKNIELTHKDKLEIKYLL
jgi:hypothetical protein